MLKDLILASRSYRSFDSSVQIDEETLFDLIDHARLCPSSINMQMLKFRPVYTATECDTVLKNTKWAAKLQNVTLPPPNHAPTAYIVICADSSVIATADKFQKDVGICAQTIMLAATEKGLGGCMIGSFSAKKLAEDLALPSTVTPQLVLALGKPAEKVEIVDAAPDGTVTYYRENGIHYVQNRALKDLILN